MRCHIPPIGVAIDSDRVLEEQQNVRFDAVLYAASREYNDDYFLVVGSGHQNFDGSNEKYMIAVVSRLPAQSNHSFVKLKSVRDAFQAFFRNHAPGFTYNFYDPPIPVKIEGSLLFDLKGINGPASARSHLESHWLVWPVTKIMLGARSKLSEVPPPALKPIDEEP